MMNKSYLNYILLALSTCILPACDLLEKNSDAPPARRVLFAEVVALDQPITYNRFGSYNPYGMMYALKRDVVDTDKCSQVGDEEECMPMSAETKPGHVRLRNDKRPRPLVLRANSGDRLEVKFYNMLMPNQPDSSSSDTPIPDIGLGLTYSSIGKTEVEDNVALAAEVEVHPPAIEGDAATTGCGSDHKSVGEKGSDNWPRTRCASITISGVTPIGDAHDPLVTGMQPIPPGATIDYAWQIDLTEDERQRRSTHLFFSHGAPAGGEGDGGSLVHGLFGVLNIEPEGSEWYRSQVDHMALQQAREQSQGDAYLNYQATAADDTPILALLKPLADNRHELVHGDLNAIIVEKTSEGHHNPAFREFTVVFHDELKTFYADQFKELATEFTLSGIGDGFAINYGASGMGTLLLANRKKIGPAKNCVNCAYEEFFLESWANGDPALLANFADDPSNVHHSYLNDRVEFRNLHAGPKETHVFHLHAHQWLSQQSDTGTYLDSQTVAPQQGFSYPIYYGGSGNRNKTPGDSIFHCHLYPHFAQGMWALWRVHDVLEDGTRRLPDGELGTGTDLVSGISNPESGTPIPAIVPLPKQAMPPVPTYTDVAGENAMPGYPFYIAGESGQRAPQAPYDVAEAAGLGRHVVTGGTRGVSGLTAAEAAGLSPDELVAHALRTGDFTSHIETADIKVLPEDGTVLEKSAMTFHSQGSHASKTPEGVAADYVVNDKPPVAGAPFADPCTGDAWELSKKYTRQYKVSAIQTDLVVNKAGWHDPQARINVLDSDVSAFENKQTDKAEPFFFRANSGDCIDFKHTNRTPTELDLDDFQVRTPTDTIGQHIHLVKFDVTASDGSGNGFNYEDGTFAKEELDHLIDAANHPEGSATDVDGAPVTLAKQDGVFQTTTQRWYADPLLTTEQACLDELATIDNNDPDATDKRKAIWNSASCKDRTIRTVFTHDHFGPSSIQQHGFYAALLVEPRDSKFLTRDGTEMPEQAVGSEAMIIHMGDAGGEEDYREFAMAIADFALLYDGSSRPDSGAENFQSAADNLQKQAQAANSVGNAALAGKITAELEALNSVLPDLSEHYAVLHGKHGRPVDPPMLPEAISKDHHNPYLVNYKHEPVPLRIGCKRLDDDEPQGKCASDSVKQQRDGPRGDMANVFSSRVHGDPATPVFAGYEGEKAQLRLIQGAQEVQHSININGQVWSREIGKDKEDKDTVLVSAQEVGISEHFEMQLGLDTILRGDLFTDYLYNFGSVDDIWNGAWGLIRSVSSKNLDECAYTHNKAKCQALFSKLECDGPQNQSGLKTCLSPLAKHRADGSGAEILNVDRESFEEFNDNTEYSCPQDAPTVHYSVAAVDVGDWLGRESKYRERIFDPDSLAFVVLERYTPEQVSNGEAKDYVDHLAGARDYATLKLNNLKSYYSDHPLEPLVLRANAGQCVRVALFNMLPEDMGDAAGDALMPKIVPLNVDQTAKDAYAGAGDVKPSSQVSMHAQKVFYTVDQNDGSSVGWNSAVMAPSLQGCDPEDLGVCTPRHYHWYAGTVSLKTCEDDASKQCMVAQPRELGASNIVSLGDVINHPVHGLIGGLIIEPENASYTCIDVASDEDSERTALHIGCGIRADISYADKQRFREFVVFYRDGLNLHYQGDGKDNSYPIPDCLICDDSYDLGEKGLNYTTEPFWARLGQSPALDSASGRWALPELNGAFFPTDFFLETYKPVATPRFVANAGEEVRFRVLQPSGRARQRAFLVYGHDFPDMLPEFGSPHAPLISVGKAITARIDSAHSGLWQYRDGPSQMWSSGAWGIFEVKEN